MYVARYRTADSALVQALFRIEANLDSLPDFDESWLARFKNIVEAMVATAKTDFAFRVTLDGKAISRLLICTSSDETILDEMARSFGELNRIVADSIKTCADRKTHDEASVATRTSRVANLR